MQKILSLIFKKEFKRLLIMLIKQLRNLNKIKVLKWNLRIMRMKCLKCMSKA